MPAPEQTSLEEGLQQTTQEPSTSPGMETEATATTILASVKEQVLVFCGFLKKSVYISEASYMDGFEFPKPRY